MQARVLVVGDVHLGRRPGGIPADLADGGLHPRELTPAAAWRNVVEYALRERLDALVLAGDVVESVNARFEALGPLEAGVRRLTDAGIQVLAVAGNHDVEVLPRLAGLIPEFELLGRGGVWKETVIECRGRAALRVLGWSFPATKFNSSPIASADLPEPAGDGLPRIGVMHCDLDSSGGPYAPVPRAELRALNLDGWFLGHVHKPSDLSGPKPIGYLGSLIGLDPTETGLHGPWLLEVGTAGGIRAEQVPLSPLRWEETVVPVGSFSADSDLLEVVADSLRELHDRIEPSLQSVRAVGCRVRLTGATPFHAELTRRIASSDVAQLRRHQGDVVYFVDKIIDDTRPRIELEAIAGEDHPAGLLARRLIDLEQNRPEAGQLIEEARKRLDREAREPRWSQLDRPPLSDERIRELLVKAAFAALEELLRQAGTPPGDAQAS